MEIDAHQADSVDDNFTTVPIISTENLPTSPSKSAKSSANTETSTIDFGHEPFITYQQRVKDLCRSLWPDSTRRLRVDSLLSGRVVSLLHGKKFL